MKIGDFEILGTIGGGSSGIVYRALNQTLGRRVALKQLHKAVHDGDPLFNRFRREAQIMASVRSAHVVTVYSFQVIDGRPLLEMECLEHGSLEQLLASAPLPFSAALPIVEDILTGLHALHEAGVVHRDVKPGNVLQDETGRYKLTDFGISMVEAAGKPTLEAATIRYLAPECVGEPPACDARSDLYSVGMVAYELLLGNEGFREAFATLTPLAAFAPRWLQWLKDQRQEASSLHTLRPDIPVPVSHFVARLLAKDPQLRYASADAALHGLRLLPYTREVGAATPPPSVKPEPRETEAGKAPDTSWELEVRVEKEGESPTVLTFARSPVTIGSAPQCDVVLSDPYVSGEHARIVISRATIAVIDQSRNGSFVGGQPVKRATLGQAGEMRIPPYRLRLDLRIGDRRRDTWHRELRHAAEPPDSTDAQPETVYMRPGHAAATPVLRVIAPREGLGDQTYPLAGERLIIGRSVRAQIRLDSTTVSRQHVELLRQRDGTWLALDLNSANGIAVNGKRVVRHVLSAGDVLTVGPEIQLQYVAPEPAAVRGGER